MKFFVVAESDSGFGLTEGFFSLLKVGLMVKKDGIRIPCGKVIII